MIPCDIPFVDLKGDMITVSAALSLVLHRMGCYALAGGNCCPFPKDVDSTLSLAFNVKSSFNHVRALYLTVCGFGGAVPRLRTSHQRD